MGIENEELELEQELDQEPEDRGDEVSPDLLDDEPGEVDAGGDEEQEEEVAGAADGADLDPDVLRELAGEEDKPRMIPHARFNEVNESLKAEREARLRLEEELARARGAAPPAKEEQQDNETPAFDFDDADSRLDEAMYEGDSEKAKQIRAEIRAAERAELERLADERAEALYRARMEESEKARAATELEQAAAEVTAKFSFLDSSSPDMDEDAIGDVVALRDSYIGRGMKPGEALTRAADRVARILGHGDEPEAKPDGKKEDKPTLTPEQIEQSLEREKRIPARDKGVGERANRIDYENLSDDEFDRLSESEKRKARGDFVG